MWQYMQWVYGTNQNFEVRTTFRFRNRPTGDALFAGYNQGTSMIQYLRVTAAAMAHGRVQVRGHMGDEFRDMMIRLPRGAGMDAIHVLLMVCVISARSPARSRL